MKAKPILILSVLSLIMGITSCKKATFLKVDNDTIRTTIRGTEGDIKIETDGRKVEVAHAPQWIKTTVSEDNDTLHYVVELNTDRQLREDSIVLKSSDLTCAILVSQTFKATYIKFSPEEVTIPSKGGSVEVMVETDSEGTISTSDHSTIASVEGKKIIVTLPKNIGTRNNVYSIKVTCDDITEELKVTQGNSKCRACNGTGFSNRVCPECNGVGLHYCCQYTGKAICNVCGGSGITDN